VAVRLLGTFSSFDVSLHVTTHKIAGIIFRTESDVPIPHLHEDPFGQFWVRDGEADVCCRFRQFDPDSLALPPLDSQERERIARSVIFPRHWLDKPTLRSPEVRVSLHKCLDRPELVHIGLRGEEAIIRDFARNELDFLYPPGKRKDFTEPIIVASYRNLLAAFLPNFSAVMIHGAGVIRDGVAAVFLASDGGGKTSVVRHSDRVHVLNDDHIILRQEGDVVTAHGTPFGPLTSGPQQARLGAFFLLEKALHFELTPIKPSEVLQFLWNERKLTWYVLPKSLRLRAFEILYDACRQAVVYRMRFPEDYVDWDAIDAAMVR
jgi:hypothetical protein